MQGGDKRTKKSHTVKQLVFTSASGPLLQHEFTPLLPEQSSCLHSFLTQHFTWPFLLVVVGLVADSIHIIPSLPLPPHTHTPHKMQHYRFVESCGRAALTGLAPRVRHTIGSGYAAPKPSLGTVSNPCRFMILIQTISPTVGVFSTSIMSPVASFFTRPLLLGSLFPEEMP